MMLGKTIKTSFRNWKSKIYSEMKARCVKVWRAATICVKRGERSMYIKIYIVWYNILTWLKSSFGFFHTILGKNSNFLANSIYVYIDLHIKCIFQCGIFQKSWVKQVSLLQDFWEPLLKFTRAFLVTETFFSLKHLQGLVLLGTQFRKYWLLETMHLQPSWGTLYKINVQGLPWQSSS